MEQALRDAVADLGYELIRAHPYKESEKHGFISSQKEGIQVFAGVDRHALIRCRRVSLAVFASPAAGAAGASGADSDVRQLVGHVARTRRHA